MSFFGKNIRSIRLAYGLSQTSFADLFGITRATIGAYEEERAEPKVDIMVAIARHFGLTLDMLVCNYLSDSDIKRFASTYSNYFYVSKINRELYIKNISLGQEKPFLPLVSVPWLSGDIVVLNVDSKDSSLFEDGDIAFARKKEIADISIGAIVAIVMDNNLCFGKISAISDALYLDSNKIEFADILEVRMVESICRNSFLLNTSQSKVVIQSNVIDDILHRLSLLENKIQK